PAPRLPRRAPAAAPHRGAAPRGRRGEALRALAVPGRRAQCERRARGLRGLSALQRRARLLRAERARSHLTLPGPREDAFASRSGNAEPPRPKPVSFSHLTVLLKPTVEL